MSKIAESELIINNRGAVYHINMRPEELADTVILVGDPGRIAEVSKYFDSIEHQQQYREFISHTGYVGKKRITVISTGIGPDNIDIVMNELDAVANIDFESRTVNKELKSLMIFRVGTCGSLQADIAADDFVAGTHGLGIDNLLNYYQHTNNEEENILMQHFMQQTHLNGDLIQPYIATASPSLLRYFVTDFKQGITVTCPGFYGPQGRVLRLGLTNPHLIDRLTDFSYGRYRICNFEMETSAIYGLGRLLGHQCLSLNVVVANRINKTFTKDGAKAVDNLIQTVLPIIEKI